MLRNSLALCIFVLSLPLWASTTPQFNLHVQPLLEKNSAFAQHIHNTYEIENNGYNATQIGEQAATPIVGKFIGPYSFRAKTRGSTDDYNLKITFYTTVSFYNEIGQSVPFSFAAVEIRETINDFSVEPLRAPRKTKALWKLLF